MGHWIKLKASDGFELGAWRAEPKGAPRGVVGRRAGNLRRQCAYPLGRRRLRRRRLSRDRARPFSIAANETSISPTVPRASRAAWRSSKEIPREATLLDIGAAVEAAKSAGKVGVVGYCLGGTLAWVAAAQSQGLSAAVGYYGGGIIGLKDLKPRVPTMLHFGEKDEHIPVAGVREIAAAHPDVPIYLYPAGHAFNRDVGAGYRRAERGPGEITHAGVLRQASGVVAQASRAPWASTFPRRGGKGNRGRLYFTSRGPPAPGVSFSWTTPRRRATSV